MDHFQKIEAVFKRLDKDRSGDIDKSEIKRFFKKAAGENHSERNKTADKLLEYFDKDGDGCIDFGEFKEGIKNLERGEGAAFLKSKLQFFFENERLDPRDNQLKTFAIFLKETDSKEEAKALWEEAGKLQAEKERLEDEIRSKASAVFSKLDLDGNGWIDAMELKRFFRKIAGESQLERRRTAAELLRFFDRNGDGLIDELEFELGCLLVQQSEGDEFIEKKLELLFAIDGAASRLLRKNSIAKQKSNALLEVNEAATERDETSAVVPPTSTDSILSTPEPMNAEERAWMNKVDAVFYKLDADGSGDIDAHELKQFFKAANKEHSLQRRKTAAELIKYFDDDGDGRIDLQEFRDGMNELLKVEGKFVLRKIDILFADSIEQNKPVESSQDKSPPAVENAASDTDTPGLPAAAAGPGPESPKTASGFMRVYGPKEGLRMYMAQQAAVKAAKAAKLAEEEAQKAAKLKALAWHERYEELSPSLASLRDNLKELQEVIVPCGTSGAEFLKVLDVVRPIVDEEGSADKSELLELAREFSASCLERHASGSPSHEEASKAVFKDFESYVLVVAEKHFREGKRFDGSDNDAETSDTEAEKPADDSNPFSGMEGARDVTAARQVIDFFAGVVTAANNALTPTTDNLDVFSKVFGRLHGVKSFYKAAKQAVETRKQSANVAEPENPFDKFDDAVSNGDDDTGGRERSWSSDSGSEPDVVAVAGSNPFDDFDSDGDDEVKSGGEKDNAANADVEGKVGWDDSLFESPLPFVVTEARRLFREGIISQSEYEQMVVGQIKFEREKRRESVSAPPPRPKIKRSVSEMPSSSSKAATGPNILRKPGKSSKRLSRAVSASVIRTSSPTSSINARIEAKLALAASRRRSGGGTPKTAKDASAATADTQQKLEKAMVGMAANAQKTEETLQETTELKNQSSSFASAAQQIRKQQQKKKKLFFGLF